MYSINIFLHTGAGAHLQRPVGDRGHAGGRGREHRVQRRRLHVPLHAQMEEPRGGAVLGGAVSALARVVLAWRARCGRVTDVWRRDGAALAGGSLWVSNVLPTASSPGAARLRVAAAIDDLTSEKVASCIGRWYRTVPDSTAAARRRSLAPETL